MKSIIVLSSIFIITTSAFAADDLELGEVVVTATRTEDRTLKVPANVTVITEDDIKESASTTVQELLQNESGLLVRDFYGNGSKSTVDMRGFAKGLNTLVLIDGRRVNEIDLSGVDWGQIPLENIERVEIVRGSGSVLYGDNATAGVINIITKRGKKDVSKMDAEVRMENYGGNMQYLGLTGNTEKVDYFFFAKHLETDGYRENNEFNAKDIGIKLSSNAGDRVGLDLAVGYHLDRQGIPGGLSKSDMDADRRQSNNPDDGVEYDQYFYDANLTFDIDDESYLSAGYSFSNRYFDLQYVTWGSRNRRDTDIATYKLMYVNSGALLGVENRLVAGVDLINSDAFNVYDFFGARNNDLKKRERGYYLNDDISLQDNLLLSLGYRYTSAKYNNEASGVISGSDRQREKENSYKTGLTYNYTKVSKAYVVYTQGFRMPSTDELFSVFSGSYAPLKPESAESYEFGLSHRFNSRLKADLAYYDMKVKDELHYNPLTFANENLEETRHKGLEAGITFDIDNTTIFGNYAYSRATFEAGPNSGKTIPLVPKHTATLGANVNVGKTAFSVAGNWVNTRFQDSDEQNTGEKIPSYKTVDTKVTYTLKGLALYLGADNLFNEKFSDYAAYGTYYPAPERRYYGGIKATF